MTERTLEDRIAEAIWAMPSARRLTSWEQMDEKTKELWREDARRVMEVLRDHQQKGEA